MGRKIRAQDRPSNKPDLAIITTEKIAMALACA
jgi:hypothetical protein